MSVLTNNSAVKNKHQWQFVRLGGFDQVKLERAEDLLALAELDQKLWAALSCPTEGVYFDSRTLTLLDTDQDGRIRVPEIIEALQWTTARLNNPIDLKHSHSVLSLDAIDQSHPQGMKLLASAREILKVINKAEANEISIADVADISQIFAKTRFNGDGIVPISAVEDAACQQVIADILDCLGGETDRCGEIGVNQEKVDYFFAQAQAYLDWWGLYDATSSHIWPLREDTVAAVENFKRVKAKIDDYFTRCQLAEFDPQAAMLLNPSVAQYEQVSAHNLSSAEPGLMVLPVSKIDANKALPLSSGLNPAWATQIEKLNQQVLKPLFGNLDSLSLSQWQEVNSKFADYDTWLQNKQGADIEKLGVERLKEILAGDYQAQLNQLIVDDLALAPEAEAIEAVERLIYYYRDLYRLLNNFVSFRDFYTPKPNSIFQAGTLYLDGRSCNLCLKVDDINKHSSLASSSLIFLAYCECSRPESSDKLLIAAGFTSGDADNLMLGRNGIFYDRLGYDWDATIVKIIEHPISISQAFWSPYKRLAKMISEQLEKFAAASDKAAQEKTLASSLATTTPVETGKHPVAIFDVGKYAGIFAAVGLGIGAIGTAIASIITGLLSLAWWKIPLALVGVILFISGPSMLIASLKLHRRNLAPVLDASGWAVNTKAYINIPFGRLLTATAKLPKNAQRQLLDPFADKPIPWRRYFLLIILLAIILLCWQEGLLSLPQ